MGKSSRLTFPGEKHSEIRELRGMMEYPLYADISDYIPLLYFEGKKVFESRGRVVELGVRDGGSTTALLMAKYNGHGINFLISYDIDGGCFERVRRAHRELCIPERVIYDGWDFRICDSRLVEGPADIDLLFIDTSHEFRATLDELRNWGPAVKGRIFLHDTELRQHNWNVKRAIIEYMCEDPSWDTIYLTHGYGMGIMERIHE